MIFSFFWSRPQLGLFFHLFWFRPKFVCCNRNISCKISGPSGRPFLFLFFLLLFYTPWPVYRTANGRRPRANRDPFIIHGTRADSTGSPVNERSIERTRANIKQRVQYYRAHLYVPTRPWYTIRCNERADEIAARRTS